MIVESAKKTGGIILQRWNISTIILELVIFEL